MSHMREGTPVHMPTITDHAWDLTMSRRTDTRSDVEVTDARDDCFRPPARPVILAHVDN